jgi:hypothetical protein
MFPVTHHFIAACFAGFALGSTAAAASPEVRVTDLHPFTHVAYVPVGADLSSIKFKGVKAVHVATKLRSVTNTGYCGEGWAEPDGAKDCPHTTMESPVPAYQVSYSYNGQAMASDEYGNIDFTFSVYFGVDELSAEVRKVLASSGTRQTAAAEFFRFTTSGDPARQLVIDQANSTFCDGNYADGNWIHTNTRCEDQVTYMSATSASTYITVRVDLASSRLEMAATGSQPR